MIDEFLANLKGGGARANLFRVTVAFPTDTIASGDEVKQFTFRCKGAQIPPSTLGVIEIPYRGRQIKVAGDRTFPEWTVTVLNDTDFKERNAFERWSNSINQHEANTGIANPVDYQATATVEQLDHNDNVLKTYTFEGVWPSEIGEIELNFDNTDTVEEFTVTLVYQWWSSDTTT